MNMFDDIKIKTFELKDLVDRTLMIKMFKSCDGTITVGVDVNTGELFVLECIPVREDIQG